MAELYLSLGTNLGDRLANLDRAISLLNEFFGSCPLRCSPRIETAALGFEGPPFLNCIVVYETEEAPESLLAACKAIEERMGRHDSPEYDSLGGRIYHDRIIDIDILLYGAVEINTDNLVIPHPQVRTRPFIRQLLDTLDK